jgi:hypothetical protein
MEYLLMIVTFCSQFNQMVVLLFLFLSLWNDIASFLSPSHQQQQQHFCAVVISSHLFLR